MFSITEKEKRQIYLSSLEVLEKVGVEIRHEKALDLLKDAGAEVVENKAFIPPYLVEEAIQTAPKAFPIYDREGNKALKMGHDERYFGSGSDNPHTLDPNNHERRPSTLKDVKNYSIIADALPNFDFFMSMALPTDLSTEVADLKQFKTMTNNCTKPIVFTAPNSSNITSLLEMASVIAGGRSNLAKKPFLIQYTQPTSPLVGSEDALERLLKSVDYGVPATYTAGALHGASAPITVEGTAVQCLAESLSGVVISQLEKPGAPIIIGGAAAPMDMKTTVTSYGAPSSIVTDFILCEVSKYIDMPVFSEAGYSDSKVPDGQAAIESSLSIFGMMSSRADLIHDVGYLESGEVSSAAMMVIGDEIIGFVKNMINQLELNEERLALEVIERVGPGGNYLTDPHTMDHFKENYDADLMDRRNYEGWLDEGGKDLADRSRERVQKILENYEPNNLGQSKLEEIDKLISKKEKAG